MQLHWAALESTSAGSRKLCRLVMFFAGPAPVSEQVGLQICEDIHSKLSSAASVTVAMLNPATLDNNNNNNNKDNS